MGSDLRAGIPTLDTELVLSCHLLERTLSGWDSVSESVRGDDLDGTPK